MAGYSAEVSSVSNLRVGVIEIYLVKDVEESALNLTCLLSVMGVDLLSEKSHCWKPGP